ncbi:maleylpyruvate isomerase family mycothiol-dependent enzyme [Rhizohabitans arisaemae]|uniref:maleylpyruvate isomerase family mycothiol-dependent enzyme n=1 Tax=Rhizohabitans arisaemae TaxID=2720610 RepID=UPI0024B19318|nr:maleylpyruvate isomerase family mycothiol-dependent enzyme [Rhizohabitans arisaemae]
MTGDTWSHERYTALVAAEIDAMARTIRDRDPLTPVPSCPGWTLADLIRHTGSVHRWAARLLVELRQRGLRREDAALPADPGEYPDWLIAGGEELTRALRSADPDTPMWSLTADRRLAFWSRRQLHETVVHHADAVLALGGEPSIDPGTALDGVDEFFAILTAAARYAPRVRELTGDGETLAFRSGDQAWLVRLAPDGFTWSRERGPATVTVTAESPGDLLLLLWGRPSRVEVEGDVKLLPWWTERSAI